MLKGNDNKTIRKRNVEGCNLFLHMFVCLFVYLKLKKLKLRRTVPESFCPKESTARSMHRTFSLVLSKNLSPEKLSNFAKLLFCDAKNDQNTNFTNCQVPNGVFVNSTIPKLKFCKIAQLIIRQFLL